MDDIKYHKYTIYSKRFIHMYIFIRETNCKSNISFINKYKSTNINTNIKTKIIPINLYLKNKYSIKFNQISISNIFSPSLSGSSIISPSIISPSIISPSALLEDTPQPPYPSPINIYYY